VLASKRTVARNGILGAGVQTHPRVVEKAHHVKLRANGNIAIVVGSINLNAPATVGKSLGNSPHVSKL
jgi:hypothetical protein